MLTPRNQSNAQAHAGFTMVELLVVISIIAVLAGLLMPAVIGAMRRAHETKTLNLIHQCETAVLAYYNDYGDYPPSTWLELGFNPAFPASETTNPDTFNQGIEVFTFCLASQTGGPYLEVSNEMLGNTDGPDTDADGLSNGGGDTDTDLDGDGTPDVLQHTNYYFGGTQVFEIVDFWGNPLVYVHNRDYMAHDGWRDDLAIPAWENPNSPPASPPALPPEYLKYVDSEGNTRPCYARSTFGFATQNYPKLDSFQLYSWGPDLYPGCEESTVTPGTPNPGERGLWPGWNKNSRNLTNWQE